MAGHGQHFIVVLRLHVQHLGTSSSLTPHLVRVLATDAGGRRDDLTTTVKRCKEASTPLFSVPAIGWPGTRKSGNSPNASRADSMTLRFELPASVTTASAARWLAIARKTAVMAPMGTHNTTM